MAIKVEIRWKYVRYKKIRFNYKIKIRSIFDDCI